MSGFPVVISDNGIPVVSVEEGAPAAVVAENGLGVPITLASSGVPLVISGLVPEPALSTDFRAGTLDPEYTFARASTATFVGFSGLVTSAGSGVPRFDHDPGTLEPLGLLIEEQRTNVLVRSDAFDNASWSKSNASVSANAVTSPAGALGADTLTEDSATSTHLVSQAGVTIAAGFATYSVWGKNASGTRFLQLRPNNLGGGIAWANFDLVNGLVVAGDTGGSEFVAASIQGFPNGWYRCVMIANHASAPGGVVIALSNGTGELPSYTGDGASGVHLWGAQLEAGPFVTSYIPTTDSPATRAADSLFIQDPDFSALYNVTEGTIVTQLIPVFADTNSIEFYPFSAIGGATNYLLQHCSTVDTRTGALVSTLRNSASMTIDSNTTTAFVSGQVTRAGMAYSMSAIAHAWNGGNLASTANTSTMPTPTSINIASGAGAEINGWLQTFDYYDTSVADLEPLTEIVP